MKKFKKVFIIEADGDEEMIRRLNKVLTATWLSERLYAIGQENDLQISIKEFDPYGE